MISHKPVGLANTLRHIRGWKRDATDTRDHQFSLKIPHGLAAAKLPAKLDLRPQCPPIRDQGSAGSCTAHALSALVEFNETKKAAKPHQFTPISTLFEYYVTRKIEGTVSEDSGASIRDSVKAAVKYGVVAEAEYPYNTNLLFQAPPATLYTTAKSHEVTSYHKIADGDLHTMKSALNQGYLVEYGFSVYSYFMSAQMAQTGILLPPGPSESQEGGHAQALVGYDDNMKSGVHTGFFIVRNSWGNWGLQGYYFVAYDYLANTKLASDYWIVESEPI